MNYSTDSSQINNGTSNNTGFFTQNFSYSQLIGVILAGIILFVSILVLLFFIIYQKYRLRNNKLNNVGLTSNNPCYVGSSMSQFDRSNGHAHCNMTVSTDFYDIDDLTSLDNDSFLNSLENAIFVGYLNHSRPRSSVDDQCSESTVHSNQTVRPELQVPPTSAINSSQHSHKKSIPARKSATNSSLKTGKCKVSTTNIGPSNHDSMRIRAKSETISESIGSTSNLITSSKMFLDDSNDSVCDTGKDCHQLTARSAIESSENPGDSKAESSTDSHTSVNSSSAMMCGYSDKQATSQGLPDIINSSLPRKSKELKRTSSNYSNNINREDFVASTNVQILDPLRAGQNLHFINDIVPEPGPRSRHKRHCSYNNGVLESNVQS